jgi:predicted transcriptional regulator
MFSLTTTNDFVLSASLMMRKSKAPKPTDAELIVLRVLWQRGPSTVREVWEQTAPRQRTGYTTVLKIMQIMFEKGLLKRDDTARSHVYSAAVSEEQTQRQVIRHLLERVFSGSAPKLVMQALATKKASPAELAEIRNLLDEVERGSK